MVYHDSAALASRGQSALITLPKLPPSIVVTHAKTRLATISETIASVTRSYLGLFPVLRIRQVGRQGERMGAALEGVDHTRRFGYGSACARSIESRVSERSVNSVSASHDTHVRFSVAGSYVRCS